MGTRHSLRAIVLGACLALAASLAARGFTVLDPFQSQYRLRVSEPSEGATLTEGAVRVVAELEPRPQAAGAARDATPPPRPRLEIFLDGVSKGSPKEGQNTLTIEGVTVGTHALLVTASDPSSGAVVERKEVHFTVLPPPPQ